MESTIGTPTLQGPKGKPAPRTTWWGLAHPIPERPPVSNTDLTDIHEPQSINKQKEAAKRAAIATWQERYYDNPRTSLAYKTALRSPPDGKAHHTFNVAPTARGGRRGHEPAKFSRLNYSTLRRYITGHAFTGEYTRHFYPLHTQEQIACPCGEPLQTIEHVLTECTPYATARRRHLTASANGRPRTLPQLFANSKHVEEVLRKLVIGDQKANTTPYDRTLPITRLYWFFPRYYTPKHNTLT